MDDAGNYERMDWISLDNFLTTHPALKKISRWFSEHPEATLTAEAFSTAYGQPVSWLDLKGLAVHKVLSALDPQNQLIKLPLLIGETTQFRFNRRLEKLVADVLAKVKPGPRPETIYPEDTEHGPTAGRTWKGWKTLPPA